MFNGGKLKVIGNTLLKCSRNGKCYDIKFLVVKENVQTILGCKDSQKCGIIKVVQNDLNKNEEINSVEKFDIDVLNDYKSLFHGKGCLGGDYKIIIDETVQPVINAPRRVPFTLMEPLKEKLTELEQEGYLKKVSEPTPWVSSLVVVRKPLT